MCHYTHLTSFEREKILFFLAEGKSITGNGVTRKATTNIVASSSYRTPLKSVLPVQRTVPSVATGKRIPWWASKERHASLHWWTKKAGTCLVERPRARPPLLSIR